MVGGGEVKGKKKRFLRTLENFLWDRFNSTRPVRAVTVILVCLIETKPASLAFSIVARQTKAISNKTIIFFSTLKLTQQKAKNTRLQFPLLNV